MRIATCKICGKVSETMYPDLEWCNTCYMRQWREAHRDRLNEKQNGYRTLWHRRDDNQKVPRQKRWLVCVLCGKKFRPAVWQHEKWTLWCDDCRRNVVPGRAASMACEERLVFWGKKNGYKESVL